LSFHPTRFDPMQAAPMLPAPSQGTPVSRTVLLVNPFYPKDVNASFGKHVLTPTLALTSIAGATPAGWTVNYWDENLLQGPPPVHPLPQVVGITVHLTFRPGSGPMDALSFSEGSTHFHVRTRSKVTPTL